MVVSIKNQILIEDWSDNFTQQDLEQLEYYVVNELLSEEEDVSWLGSIRIRDEGFNGRDGYWIGNFRLDNISKKVNGINAEIVLNASYLFTLEQLKEVLAHEYGHHWTLCYLAVNQDLIYYEQRMPEEYYRLRRLSHRDYAYDYSMEWERCDKEVAAEDYRFFFAPYPHNQNHRMSQNGILNDPNRRIKHYIENIPNDSPDSKILEKFKKTISSIFNRVIRFLF